MYCFNLEKRAPIELEQNVFSRNVTKILQIYVIDFSKHFRMCKFYVISKMFTIEYGTVMIVLCTCPEKILKTSFGRKQFKRCY
jgi:hypothetical protein